MERIKYRISLDMFEVASQTTIKAKKRDTACSIHITLIENRKVYQIAEGCTAFFSARKPDGNFLFNSETCRIEDNTIIYDFTEQTTPIEGLIECEIILCKGEQRLTSPRFNLKVDSTIYNGEEIISTPEADALKELTDRAENVVNQYDKGVIVGKEYADNNFANALKGTAKGSVVSIKDVSPLEHDIKVKVDRPINGVLKGDIVTTYNVVRESNRVISEGYTPLNYVLDSGENGYDPSNFDVIELGDNHKRGFAVHFDSVDGYSNGVVLKNGTQYYTLRLCGVDGGDIACAIAENKVYLSVNNNVEVYEVPNGTEFYYIGCDGFGFNQSEIDVYNCLLDIANVNISVGGKNLCDLGTVNVSNSMKTIKFTEPIMKKGIKYTISFYATSTDTDTNNVVLHLYNTELNKKCGEWPFSRNIRVKWTITPNIDVTELRFYVANSYNAGQGDKGTFEDIQIEIGGNATDYEPYKEPVVYPVGADGTLEFKSLYLSMTIMPDTEGATVSVEYNRDINKAFQELQQVVAQLQTLAVATVPMNEGV